MCILLYYWANKMMMMTMISGFTYWLIRGRANWARSVFVFRRKPAVKDFQLAQFVH